jgi:hypothetical protein
VNTGRIPWRSRTRQCQTNAATARTAPIRDAERLMNRRRFLQELLNTTCRVCAVGGGRGIRTPGTVSGPTVFKTAAIDHSAIPPRRGWRSHSSSGPAVSDYRHLQRAADATRAPRRPRFSGIARHLHTNHAIASVLPLAPRLMVNRRLNKRRDGHSFVPARCTGIPPRGSERIGRSVRTRYGRDLSR